MKKINVVFIAALFIFQASIVFSDTTEKGTIKSVDLKTGTLVFCSSEGKDVTLKIDKSVELDKIKAGDKVEISVENDVVKNIKPEHINWCPKGF